MTLTEGQKYSVCIDPQNSITETNENNNCEVQSISATTSDLTVQTIDISMAPVGADVGEPVKVNAVVRNLKTVSSKALIPLFQGIRNRQPQRFSARVSSLFPLARVRRQAGRFFARQETPTSSYPLTMWLHATIRSRITLPAATFT